jgi:uncharacterized OsmC-like protein
MKAEELRAMQAPLKRKYRDDPASAVVTMHAESRMAEGISCRIDTGKGLIEAGLHPAAGGTGREACSGDMLLQAVAACAGVTLQAVATAIGLELADATVRVEGDLDFRGTLGVSKEAPVGFRAIRVMFDLRTQAPDEQVAKLVELAERYCVVLQTIQKPGEIQVAHTVKR